MKGFNLTKQVTLVSLLAIITLFIIQNQQLSILIPFSNTSKSEIPQVQFGLEIPDSLKSITESDAFKKLKPVHQKMFLNKLKGSNYLLQNKFQACWSPGEDYSNIKNFFATYGGNDLTSLTSQPGNASFEFEDGNRWSNTATNGGGLGQGDPTTLTWSIVPDGTSIHGYNGEPTSGSVLVAFLDGLYGNTGGADLTQREWFPLFEDIFDRWSDLTGFSYIYEPNDDGSAWTSTTIAGGALSVRGDIRISGHSIDGQSGSNVLAYNFFPNFGDMVIDTDNSNLYNNRANNSLYFRNVLSHEHGHGLGLSHSCPISETKLMEPFISNNFDGPQIDDILGANRGYGDNKEPNDNSGTAFAKGTIADGADSVITNLSIDDDSDIDLFSFTTTNAATVSITLTPAGTTYLAGAQLNNGACSGGSNFSPQSQSNLTLELLATNGSTSVITANNTGAGNSETITNQTLPDGAGTYFIKVTGDANAVQLYQLTITVNHTGLPDNLILNTASLTSGTYEACSTLSTLNMTNVTAPSGNTVIFQAGTSVTLNPGFTAVNGSDFTSRIQVCPALFLTKEMAQIKTNQNTDLFNKTERLATNLLVYPNPLQSHTIISFQITQETTIDIGLYDANGKLFKVLVEGVTYQTGQYTIPLVNQELNSGVYFLFFKTKAEIDTKKLMVLK